MSAWFNPARELDALIRRVATSVPALGADFDPQVRPATDTRHGDFQCNGVLAAAKIAKLNPRALATELLAALETEGTLKKAGFESDVAGPGFINFRLTPAALAEWIHEYRDADA